MDEKLNSKFIRIQTIFLSKQNLIIHKGCFSKLKNVYNIFSVRFLHAQSEDFTKFNKTVKDPLRASSHER